MPLLMYAFYLPFCLSCLNLGIDRYDVQPDSDCYLHDIQLFMVANIEACAMKCEKSTNCMAFVFSNGHCSIKDQCPEVQPLPTITLGIKSKSFHLPS